MKKFILFIVFGAFIILSFSYSAIASNFFDQPNKYRGFYWFETQEEQKNNKDKQESINKNEYKLPTPEEAFAAIEAIKKGLDDARNQMIAVGLDNNASPEAKRKAVIAYKKLETEMWEGTLSLVDASDMANFTNPELLDNQNEPTNVFGVKLKRQIDAEKNALSILQFAQIFDLLLFTDDSCLYCREFAPVVKNFAKHYHFQLDMTSLDERVGKAAKQLGISSVPTLVAVKKDGLQAFEVSRGMISASELEANILLAHKYSEELNKKSKRKNILKEMHKDQEVNG